MKIEKVALILQWSILGLICLGAGVRAMDAGLACPDWPLCFGKLIPDFHIQVYFEFIHRVMAGVISIATVYLAVKVYRENRGNKYLVWGALVLLVAQVIVGGLTVLKLLQAYIVMGHLLLGVLFYSVIYLLSLSIEGRCRLLNRSAANTGILFLLLLLVQIVWGGAVSSHYAGLACPDFPLCNGQILPTVSGPIGLHALHRIIAYIVAVVAGVYLWSAKYLPSTKVIFYLVLFQILLGAVNVWLKLPPLITVIHTANAVLILKFTLQSIFDRNEVEPAKART